MRPGIALTVGELATVVDGTLDGDAAPDDAVTFGPQRVTIHSAHVEPGAVFVALAGRRDGHDFVADAVANKAACAIVRRGWAPPDPSFPLVRVDDPLRALQRLAAWYRRPARRPRRRRRRLPRQDDDQGRPGLVPRRVDVLLRQPGQLQQPARRAPVGALVPARRRRWRCSRRPPPSPVRWRRLVDVLRPDTVVVTTVGDRFRRSFGSSAAYAAELCVLAARRHPGRVRRRRRRRRRLPAAGRRDAGAVVAGLAGHVGLPPEQRRRDRRRRWSGHPRADVVVMGRRRRRARRRDRRRAGPRPDGDELRADVRRPPDVALAVGRLRPAVGRGRRADGVAHGAGRRVRCRQRARPRRRRAERRRPRDVGRDAHHARRRDDRAVVVGAA